MDAALSVRDLHKGFGGVPVLKGLTFDVAPGSVVVLAGENGAGKSTLFNIITGQLAADQGEVFLQGKPLTHVNPRVARELGVAIVPQELAPYEDLSIAENIAVGREPTFGGFVLNRREMDEYAQQMLADFDIKIDPRRKMRSLSVALTQVIEIVKTTTSGAQVLLLDEPTSSIPEAETGRLYEIVHRLREKGVGMVYTTHRMQEIEAVADRVVVLRDGALVLDEAQQDLEPDQIVTAMIGRELENLFPPITAPSDRVVLRVNDLERKPGAPRVNLEVRAGEIVGIGGLVGAGRSALLQAIFGAKKSADGIVEVNSAQLHRHGVSDSINAGMALVPEDRKKDGLVLVRSILDNLTLPYLSDYAHTGVINSPKRSSVGTEYSDAVRLKFRSLQQTVGTLSGGNQQKIVIARWLDREPGVLLLDEPTRGVDVGARSEIYRIIHDLAEQGLAVLLASSDMPELIGLSNRVLVMRGNQVVGELDRDQLDSPEAQALIFHYASGEALALTPDDTPTDSTTEAHP
ncbi:MAG: sugar ABC transporter ATP-binding protein [Beutenbergiaceae bacterium]